MNSDVSTLPEIYPVPGFRLGTACAGIKSPGRRDLVIMALAEGSACAADKSLSGSGSGVRGNSPVGSK